MRGIPAFVLLAVAQGQAAPLQLRIVDENGRPAAARVRIFDEDGLSQAVTGASGDVLLAAHPNFPELGAIVRGQARIELPTGAKRIIVDRGPEYRRVELTLDGYSAGRTIRLERWIHMSEQGWWSGDMHVHRAPGDLPKLLDAADLHFAPTLTRWNAASTLDEWPSEPVIHAAPDRVYSVNNAED